MFITNDRIKHTDMVNLAPLECLCSCILTGLKLAGLNHHLFLLNCWDVQFYSGFLMSCRNYVDYEKIDTIYGTKSDLVENGSMKHLDELFYSGGISYFLCFASGFSYFPREYLSYETSGLSHTVLLNGYNREKDSVFLLDPLVDFIGEVAAEELHTATVVKDKLVYFTQYFPQVSISLQPNIHEIFANATKRNLSVFLNGESNCGINALNLFQMEVSNSIHWDNNKRDSWIDQNKLTLSSIIRMRNNVWESFQSLGVMTSDCIEKGNKFIQYIIQQWSSLIFLLLKYKRNFQNEALRNSIIRKIDEVKNAEFNFLEYLNQFGMKLVL